MTPGTLPFWRSLRATPLPFLLRSSAFSDAVAIVQVLTSGVATSQPPRASLVLSGGCVLPTIRSAGHGHPGVRPSTAQDDSNLIKETRNALLRVREPDRLGQELAHGQDAQAAGSALR